MQFAGRTWRPPYERYTPIVEATSGCAWGRCRFCSLYAAERFAVAPLAQFESAAEREREDGALVRYRAGLRSL